MWAGALMTWTVKHSAVRSIDCLNIAMLNLTTARTRLRSISPTPLVFLSVTTDSQGRIRDWMLLHKKGKFRRGRETFLLVGCLCFSKSSNLFLFSDFLLCDFFLRNFLYDFFRNFLFRSFLCHSLFTSFHNLSEIYLYRFYFLYSYYINIVTEFNFLDGFFDLTGYSRRLWSQRHGIPTRL